MARNVVQFQKGLSEPAFEQQYGTEEQCRAIVIASRWPRGFECPACGGRQYCVVTTRDLYQCAKCRRQTSPIAGTIFASTHLPLRLWFRAIYHLTQTKQGISSIELGRRLGVTQTTAWKIKHKLKQVMLEHDATEGKPVRLKLRRVTSFCATSIAGFAKRSLDPDCSVVSDGLQCRMRAPGHQDRVRTKGGSDACLQMGQHRAGQHQGRHHKNLPRHQQQACPALPRRIRIPLQQTIRSGRHDPAPHMGRRANHTHAISAPEIG
jgi:transposase-like protein